MSDDRRTHIERINDWRGSNSYVDGSRRDIGKAVLLGDEDVSRPFRLTASAWHDGRMCEGGEIVWLRRSEAGAHHVEVLTEDEMKQINDLETDVALLKERLDAMEDFVRLPRAERDKPKAAHQKAEQSRK